MSDHLKFETIGRILKSARIRAGIGLRELATRIDKSPSWVSKVEHNTEKPGSDTMRQMCKELGVSYDDAVWVSRDAKAIGEAVMRIDEEVRNGRIKGVILHLTYAGGYYCTFENYDGEIVKSESVGGVIGSIENAEQKYSDYRRLERMSAGIRSQED